MRHSCYSVPLINASLCLLSYFTEFIIVKRSSADYFKLRNSVSKLVCNIRLCIFRYRHCMVKRNVYNNTRYIKFNCKIFIPLKKCVAYIVACNNKIRERNSGCRRIFKRFGSNSCFSFFFEQFHISDINSSV